MTDLMSTQDASDLDIECTQLYSLQIEDMLTRLTADLGEELAHGMCEADAAYVAGSSRAFASLGSQVNHSDLCILWS